METGRKIFCFSNPGFCQANTGIVLKMAAAKESLVVWCGRYTATPPCTHAQRTPDPLPSELLAIFVVIANKMLNRKPFRITATDKNQVPISLVSDDSSASPTFCDLEMPTTGSAEWRQRTWGKVLQEDFFLHIPTLIHLACGLVRKRVALPG